MASLKLRFGNTVTTLSEYVFIGLVIRSGMLKPLFAMHHRARAPSSAYSTATIRASILPD
jgi:hypothetical protein